MTIQHTSAQVNTQCPLVGELRTSLTYIQTSIKSWKSTSPENFNRAVRTAEAAIPHFKTLDIAFQRTIYSIRDHLIKCSRDPSYQEQLMNTPAHFKMYQMLLVPFVSSLYDATVEQTSKTGSEPHNKIFITSLIKPCPSPPVSMEDSDNEGAIIDSIEDSFIIIPSKDSSQATSSSAPPAVPMNQLKIEQIAIIESFFYLLVKDYYGPFVLGEKENQLSLFHQYVSQEFSRLFPPIISNLFFREPGKMTDTHKTLIICALNGFRDFMHLYIQGQTSVTCDELTLQICQITQEILPIYKQLTNQETAPNDKAEELLNLLTTVSVVPFVFNKILSPHLFCTLIDIFALAENPTGTDEKEIPLEHFDASDKAFSGNVEKLIDEIIKQILSLGEGNAILQFFGTAITAFTDTIGKTIQQATNRSLASECSLTPILMLQKLLYKDGSPILLTHFAKTEEEIATYQKTIETLITEKLYQLIKGYIPTGFKWLTKRTTDIKPFCETLCQKLYNITQNEQLYRHLTLCILRSTRLGLTNLILSQAPPKTDPVPISSPTHRILSAPCVLDPSQEPDILGSFIFVPTDIQPRPLVLPPDKELKAKQVATIENFFTSLIVDYFGVAVLGQKRDQTSPVHQYAIQEFSRLFPSTISHLFFKEPGNLTKSHKALITGALRGFQNFMQLHNNVSERLSSDQLTINICQTMQDILWTYHEISHLENPSGEKLLSDESIKMLQFLTSAAIVPFVFNKILTPNIFCTIFEAFALKTPTLSLGEKEPPLGLFDASDITFSNTIGNLIKQISNELITLGKGSTLVQYIPSILGYFSNFIGSTIQQAINRSLNSECCIMPILLLKDIFYRDGEPILLKQFTMTDEEITTYQAQISQRMRTEIYDKIQSLFPPSIVSLAEYTIGLKSFCENLTQGIFDITQNEQSYKTLCFCILESIHLGLMEMKERHESIP